MKYTNCTDRLLGNDEELQHTKHIPLMSTAVLTKDVINETNQENYKE